ncbi:MAG TPA: hypothetical protein VIF82_01875 [Burkholderiaceae bacterium]
MRYRTYGTWHIISVVLAKAGIDKPIDLAYSLWIPAFAGTTVVMSM